MIDDIINHVALVIDGSGSMQQHRSAVVRVIDAQIAWLARRSTELNQETRVTAYVFDDEVKCVIFDKDVLRLPSIKDLYWVRGRTALRDAVIKSQEDLARTFAGYGNHAFLTFVVTDGAENASRSTVGALERLLSGQPDNWTVAALVPDSSGRSSVKSQGFVEGNIEIWDARSAAGMEEVDRKIQAATDSFMTQRTAGVRGSKTLFAGGAEQVNAATIQAAGLTALDPSTYMIIPVTWDDDTANWRMSGRKTKAMPLGVPSIEIKEFVESTGRRYELGAVSYRLEKSEKVDVTKDITVVHRKSSQAYGGRQARTLIGLSDTATRIRPLPVKTGEYDIYVKSTSLNRLLQRNTKIIVPR